MISESLNLATHWLNKRELTRLKKENEKLAEALLLIYRHICDFQMHYSNFAAVLHEKHKRLKQAADAQPSSIDATVQKEFDEFQRFHNDESAHAYRRASDLLAKYFSTTRGSEPRTCIKVPVGNDLIDIHRIGGPGTEITVIADNTAFSEIRAGEKAFMCNDLHLQAYHEHYKNPRLDGRKLRNAQTGYPPPKWPWGQKAWRKVRNREHEPDPNGPAIGSGRQHLTPDPATRAPSLFQ